MSSSHPELYTWRLGRSNLLKAPPYDPPLGWTLRPTHILGVQENDMNNSCNIMYSIVQITECVYDKAGAYYIYLYALCVPIGYMCIFLLFCAAMEDASNIMRVISLKNYCENTRVVVQLLHYSNKVGSTLLSVYSLSLWFALVKPCFLFTYQELCMPLGTRATLRIHTE